MRKSSLIKSLCLAGSMLILGSGVQAQFRQSIFLNGNLPTGTFASSVSENTGLPWGVQNVGKEASFGFGAGYRVSYPFPVGVGTVSPFAEADFLWNTIGSSWSQKFSQRHYSAPNYFNLPIFAGVSYLYDQLWNDITLFGEFGLGADIFFISHEGQGKGNERYAYKASTEFAWMLGAGAFFGRHVSAGLYYYNFGRHYIDYTSKTLENNTIARAENFLMDQRGERQDRTLGSLMIRIGFHF